MARPETVDDIELELTEFASVDVSLIANRGDYLKAYGTFMEAIQKIGGVVEIAYGSRATFSRSATVTEQKRQLTNAQAKWDEEKKYYDIMVSVGEVEHDYQRTYAKRHAEDMGLPWPPPFEPISDFHATIHNIDKVVAEA